MLYKVFVDDSGPHDYITPFSRDKQVNPPPHDDANRQFWLDNYFVLCGVRVKQEDLQFIDTEIRNLKTEYFGTDDVEIKSVWLRNAKHKKAEYIDKFGITEERVNAFGEAFYDLIAKYPNNLKLIATVFDKRCYGDAKRQTTDGSALFKSMQIMFERVQYQNNYNVMVIDQFEDRLKATHGRHGVITSVHQSNHDMDGIYVEKYSNITDVKFERSCDENFLQVADVCAYNVYRQFVKFGCDWRGDTTGDDGKKVLNTYPYFDKIRCNFCRNHYTGKVNGVGITCVPDSEKVNWDLQKTCPS